MDGCMVSYSIIKVRCFPRLAYCYLLLLWPMYSVVEEDGWRE